MPSSSTAAAPSTADPAHITTKIQAALARDAPFWSFEFFPPKTTQGLANLYNRIARMRANLDPSWIHVTWGAGGTTGGKSLELAGRIQKGKLDPDVQLVQSQVQQIGLGSQQHIDNLKGGESWQSQDNLDACDVCLHLTCTNVEKSSLDDTLVTAKRLGIKNILALRGDPPRGEEYWVAADQRFQHATDLVRYIRENHGDHFCIGVAGYPEGHADYVDRDVKRDLRYLKQKQDAGAHYIVTQIFYDVDQFLSWYKDCRDIGITIPILPGIMPIQNYQSFRRMTNLCKVQVPQLVLDALEPIKSDDAAVKEYGVSLSIHMIGRIFLESDVRGFHLCSLNLEKSIERILEGLGWKVDLGAQAEAEARLNGIPAHLHLERTKNQMLSDRTGANTPKDYKLTTQEALNRTLARTSSSYQVPETSTWDEFPNGRYGDSRSPAFGEMDGYGVSLKVPPQDALRIWGHPVTLSDISTIFASYLEEKISCIPWCDAPLMNETLQIRDHLLTLNRPGKSWWSVGSQPAVDGAPSTDPTVGFGPPGGFIFQKAFVELFMSTEDKDALISRIDALGPNSQVTYFAGNAKGEFASNLGENEANTVTWAVFPGKEIVQSTIIERESFEAWREEAFEIWSEWSMLFPKGSASRKLVEGVKEGRWLVTVVHHDYKDGEGLWRFLAE
ncbi:related to MET12 - methylenetetrahydrofolate reductase [Ustilago trichophora]|uniref:Related to MET12 - methylenetetrahydrofolate reductase n=1 Tax=Ustilago trichophora TaxID=86804 RepID=A0A5C3EQL5_9BASI|nr:related to MET12 - methylenetetrahydrofolate reductase [Ustilago trichophora]